MFSMKACTASLKNTRKRTILLVLVVSMLSTVLMGAMYDSQRKSVNIMVFDDFSGVNMVETVSTRQSTVEGLLKEQNMVLTEKDSVTPALDEAISDRCNVIIRKGRSINLEYDGMYVTAATTSKKVSDFLSLAGIEVNPADIVTPSLDSNLKEGDTIKIVRVTKEDSVTTERIPFSEVKVEDNNLYVGETAIRQEGADGVKEVITSTVYHDGVMVSDKEITEKVITPATDKIIAVGTKPKVNTHKGFTYKRKITVNASAYEPYNCGGDGRGITASGIKAQFGVVAVDPRVIPLGTKLYIESTDDGASWTYGYAIAADTGGAIKGNKIDLCYNTRGECIQFGRRSANVYVLN
ncbi:MAG: 3D domain-containing protein [Clostridia bacterium]|nr:3D domain-containing protein [Clostridia bacterium]